MIGHSINLKQLEALIWVADLGSFRKAAHHLNTTQPNISARISGMEKSLGVNLMQRGSGSVQMTQKGAEILAQARVILHEAEKMTEIAQKPELINNRLRLGVTELVAATWLRTFMVAIKEAYPNITIELTVDLSRNLDKDLAANRLDLAIQTAPFSAAASGVIELGLYEYVWAANAETAAELGTGEISLVTLMRHPILSHARHTQAFLELAERFKAVHASDVRLVPSNSMSAAMHMAMDGMGIAVLPRMAMEAQIDEGSLVVLEHSWKPRPLRFAARFHAEKAADFIRRSADIAAQVARKSRSPRS